MPPQIRTAIPSLVWLRFSAFSKYLGDVAARIAAHVLNHSDMTLSNRLTLYMPLLSQFIGHTRDFDAPNNACEAFQ
jgi:hypothetical protein